MSISKGSTTPNTIRAAPMIIKSFGSMVLNEKSYLYSQQAAVCSGSISKSGGTWFSHNP